MKNESMFFAVFLLLRQPSHPCSCSHCTPSGPPVVYAVSHTCLLVNVVSAFRGPEHDFECKLAGSNIISSKLYDHSQFNRATPPVSDGATRHIGRKLSCLIGRKITEGQT